MVRIANDRRKCKEIIHVQSKEAQEHTQVGASLQIFKSILYNRINKYSSSTCIPLKRPVLFVHHVEKLLLKWTAHVLQRWGHTAMGTQEKVTMGSKGESSGPLPLPPSLIKSLLEALSSPPSPSLSHLRSSWSSRPLRLRLSLFLPPLPHLRSCKSTHDLILLSSTKRH